MGLYKSKKIGDANRTCNKWFSRYIRLRDVDSSGYGKCISCGEKVHWREADAGHFIPANYLATRWNEMNCSLQCKECNMSANGNMYFHGKGIADKFGEEIPEELLRLSKESVTLTKQERMSLARHYKKLAEEMAELKGIEL